MRFSRISGPLLALWLALSTGPRLAAQSTTNTYSNGQTDSTAYSTGASSTDNLTLTAAGAATQSGIISGAGGLIIDGGGVTLSGANTYTGGTTISSGTLIGDTTSLQGAIVNNSYLTFDQATDGTYSGILSGAGWFNKFGFGNLTLSAANAFTGTFYVHNGTFTLGNANALGSGQLYLNTGGILDNGTGAALTLSNNPVQTWYTGFTFAGTNSLDLGTGAVSLLQYNATVTVDANTLTVGGVISESTAGLSLTKDGAGTLKLTGANTYSGGTTVSAGSLIGNTTSLHGAIVNNGNLTFDQAAAGTYSDVISGTGSFTKTGAGTLTLSAANTFTGTITVSAGTLALGQALTLQNSTLNTDGAGVYSFGSFTAVTIGGLSGSGPFSLTNDSAQHVALTVQGVSSTYSGVLSGTGSLVVNTGSIYLGGTNSYSGGTTIGISGSVGVGNNSALGTGVVNLGGTLYWNPSTNLTLTNTFMLTDDVQFSAGGSTGTLTLAGNVVITRFSEIRIAPSTTVAINGVISQPGPPFGGPRPLIKTGAGTLILTSANTYTGGTLISGGTLRINNTSGSAFGTGAVTVASGATLTGAGTFTGALQVNGTYSPGNSPAFVSEPGDIAIGSTGLLAMEIGGLTRGTDYDVLAVGGTFTAGGTLSVSLLNSFTPTAGATFDLLDWGTLHGTFTTLDLPALDGGLSWDTTALYSTGSLSVVSAIPEPSTCSMLAGLAVSGLVFLRRRRT